MSTWAPTAAGTSSTRKATGRPLRSIARPPTSCCIAGDDGRFFTLGADKLPGARGFGEPIRNTLDIDAEAQIVALIVHKPGLQLLLASSTGKGFAALTDELLAETRKGRQVVNLKDRAQARRGRGRSPPDTIMSRWSATTASWWSSASRNCRS